MEWYTKQATGNDVVISTRVRLARNLSDYPFATKLDAAAAREIIDKVASALKPHGFALTDMTAVTPLEAQSYVEKHIISTEFAKKKSPHALLLSDALSVAVMVCEEDHIRLQCLLPGFELERAYENACKVDDILDEALNLAYDEKLGYLTHCPTNLGTGIRASVMVFLPALTMTSQISGLSAQLSKIGLTIRGLYGEGSASKATLYQISNQVTLGITEEDTLKKLKEIISKISEDEMRLRREIFKASEDALTDKILRSVGALRYARLISSEEFFSLYADIRLGISLGIVKDIAYPGLDPLLYEAMPASLVLKFGDNFSKETTSEQIRDRMRATFLKSLFAQKDRR